MKRILVIYFLFIATVAIAQNAPLQSGLALKYVVQQPTEPGATTPVIILLHGYGSNEQDLFGLKNIFPANFLIVSARAPYSIGDNGYQWFEIGTVNTASNAKNAQLDNSRDLVVKFISQITTKYKADPEHVYVMGFSQGAMISYEVGLTVPDKVKGIGVLSGRMFPSLKSKIRQGPALKKLSIFIAHGSADDRIKYAEGKAAADYLESLGLKPEFHQYKGMGHTINNDVLKDLLKWLKSN